MGGVLEAAFGQWGSVFVSVGLIVSVLGADLAWTLMAAEVLFVAAQWTAASSTTSGPGRPPSRPWT